MLENYIKLQQVLGVGSVKTARVFEKFGNPDNIFKTDEETLAESRVLSFNELRRVEKLRNTDVSDILRDCENNGIEIITFGDKRYPYCLSVIDSPPVLLYVKGKLPDFDNIPTACIVGPRKVSDYGKKAAYSLARRLALSGFNIVSGGALGADSAAHIGALKVGGKTALVMGCGLLSDYLKVNEQLRNAVAASGCLISEFSPKQPAGRATFPVRNRIMSGLSLCTVVVEAKSHSGSLITARYAAEQGRDVFVIPGAVTSPDYEGSNALLRDGAKPLIDLSDIFNEYIPRFPDKIDLKKAYEKHNTEVREKTEQGVNKKLSIETLSKNAKIVYNHLDKHRFYPEEIKDTGLEPSEIIAALTELEIELMIRSVPGGCYELINK